MTPNEKSLLPRFESREGGDHKAQRIADKDVSIKGQILPINNLNHKCVAPALTWRLRI